MARTLNDLADRMDALDKNIKSEASLLTSRIALAIVNDVVWHTPVDTSRALSNWQVYIGVDSRRKIPPYFMGSHGSTHFQSADMTIGAAESKLSKKRPGQSIWIVNNIPYIIDLNQGSSRQAPAGFYERALAVGHRVVIKYKLKL